MDDVAERNLLTDPHKTNDTLFDLLKPGSTFVIEQDGKSTMKSLIRFCKISDLEDIMVLQKRVYDSLHDKDTFVISTPEEIAQSLNYDICIGAYHHGMLIAFTLMVIYPFSPRNLGLYMDYSPEQSSNCVTYDTTFIDPTYQGYGLQRIFIKMKDKLAKNLGAVEALATVSPTNKYSLRNLEASGFSIVTQKKLYGDFDRYILRKALTKHVRKPGRT